VTGPLVDSGYLRVLITVGMILVVFGIMMTSLATQYYQVPSSSTSSLFYSSYLNPGRSSLLKASASASAAASPTSPRW
jgi:hypothetical protein